MEGEDFEAEEFMVAKSVNLAFHGFDFVFGAFERAGGDPKEPLAEWLTRRQFHRLRKC
jgi:hypothetical protein